MVRRGPRPRGLRAAEVRRMKTLLLSMVLLAASTAARAATNAPLAQATFARP
jgi:hypothetical protein